MGDLAGVLLGRSRGWESSAFSPLLLHEKVGHIYAIGLMLLGAQFMSIGFLAELFIAYREPDQTPYSILESTKRSRVGRVQRVPPR